MQEITSRITAVEESDGQDFFIILRPIVIVSNERHNLCCHCP